MINKEAKSIRGILLFVIFLLLLAIGSLIYIQFVNSKKEEEIRLEKERITKKEETIKDIKSHYGKSVIVTKDTTLTDEKGNIVGTIYKDVIVDLNDTQIDENTKYFSIKNLNYNIDYSSVEPSETSPKIAKLSKENRYKNYIPYNKNIVTKDSYSLYYDGHKEYTFNKSDMYPIIINDYENYYYVEYNNKLYSIHEDEVKELVSSNNTTKKNKDYITTLCYHRVYKDEKCNDTSLCLKQETFDTQMNYLKENNYFTLTSEEMYMYIGGNIQVEKGVLVTLDDGWLLAAAIEVFDKYDLNGVSFTGTIRIEDGSFSLEKTYNSENVEVQSHTHNMHRNWVCSKKSSRIGSSSQGGAILCESEDFIINDLKKSITLIEDMGKNKVIALAYPFYDFNDRAISLIKQTGLKIAFTGVYGKKGRAVVGNDPYVIPRIPIRESTNFNAWKGYL